jgi:dihydrofolate synthase/folylpolyglutamate synthase
LDPLEYLFGLEHFGIKLGLDNISALVEALGHPERTFKSIHIAGTNGKGSVTAMVERALRAAGHASARYTSPHLVDLTERFVVNGHQVSKAVLSDAVEAIRVGAEGLRSQGALLVHPTFFEVTTAAAFELFRRAGVEVAVLEVGLGGRFDATNVVSPIVTAITSIALDHEAHLGATLREIAFEKAGIIKPGVPVVLGDLPREAAGVIERVAGERDAPIVRAGVSTLGDRCVGLRGAHQRGNAAVAVAVLEAVNRQGIRIPEDAIEEGLSRPDWPGRLDFRRVDNRRELWMDAAHNPAGAAALAAFLASQPAKLPLVFGAMRDKDATGMLAALLPETRGVILTRAASARAADPEDLASCARKLSPSAAITVVPSVSEALKTAWDASPRVVVAGSIVLLGEVLSLIELYRASAEEPGVRESG